MPKIHILMVSSILRNTPQVEHTKKCNSIDSENKSVKQNAGSSELFNSVFLRVTLVYSKKMFFALAECAD